MSTYLIPYLTTEPTVRLIRQEQVVFKKNISESAPDHAFNISAAVDDRDIAIHYATAIPMTNGWKSIQYVVKTRSGESSLRMRLIKKLLFIGSRVSVLSNR